MKFLPAGPFKNQLKKQASQTKKQTVKTQANKDNRRKRMSLEDKTETEAKEKTECINCGKSFAEDWIHCTSCKERAQENGAELKRPADNCVTPV